MELYEQFLCVHLFNKVIIILEREEKIDISKLLLKKKTPFVPFFDNYDQKNIIIIIIITYYDY